MVHTVPYYEQPNDISNPVPARPAPVPTIRAKEYLVEEIFAHRPRGRGYSFPTRTTAEPKYDTIWLSPRNFVESDGTTKECFLTYLENNDMQLPETAGRKADE